MMRRHCFQSKSGPWLLLVIVPITLWLDDGILRKAAIVTTSRAFSSINLEDGVDGDIINRTGAIVFHGVDNIREEHHVLKSPSPPLRELDDSEGNTDAHTKPLFILHVGPPKTGTTTIQWYAANHEELLQKHNIYYLGHYGKHAHQKLHPLSYACKQKKKQECGQAWEELGRAVREHYKKGHNVFLSEEIFSNYNDERHEEQYLFRYLVAMLEKWNVRIILGYRRYYEWAPSWYGQMNQPNKINGLKVWPHEGGRYLPTFAEYMASNETTMKSFQQLSSLKAKWSSNFPNDNIWIFNMHQPLRQDDSNPKDALVQVLFFCQMIPEAPSFCDYVKSEGANETTSKNKSSSKALHLDMLLLEGYKRGWISNKNITRPSAQKAILQFAHQELNYAKPSDFGNMTCPTTDQTQQLLDWSLQLEQETVPQFFESPMGERDMKRQFQSALDYDKFCSIDVHDALRDENTWKRFFRNIKDATDSEPR